jgi:hypothetical protein
MAARGPIPKRATDRRRTNKPASGEQVTKAPAARKVAIPRADRSWHQVARRWYQSLAKSGQSRFYEPSDWATAFLVAESLSRELDEQVVGFSAERGIERAFTPLKGASLSAYLKAMSSLLVTEGDRRRARLELQRATAVDQDEQASVTSIAGYQAQLGA